MWIKSETFYVIQTFKLHFESKRILQYELCKVTLLANFVKCLYNLYKRSTGKLNKYNDHNCRIRYYIPGSKFLAPTLPAVIGKSVDYKKRVISPPWGTMDLELIMVLT